MEGELNCRKCTLRKQWGKKAIYVGKNICKMGDGGPHFRGCGDTMGSCFHKPVQQCQNRGRKGSSEVNDVRLIV